MIELVFPASLIPIIILVLWIRNIEKYKKQSWISIAKMFFWGAVVASSLTLIFQNLIGYKISSFLILSVIIAPIVEESFKVLGFRFIKSSLVELEDGLIYGVVIGFGFAATENLLYLSEYYTQGLIVIISLLYLRTIGSTFMHATATSITGYGYTQILLEKHSILKIIPFFILSILIHSLFNLFVYSAIIVHQIIGIELSVMFALLLMYTIRKNIIHLDTKLLKKPKISILKIRNIFKNG